MKQVNKYKCRKEFIGEDGDRLTVGYDNRGEPFREGVELNFRNAMSNCDVFLEDFEAKELRDLLIEMYPPRST